MKYIKLYENFIHEPFPTMDELKDYLLPIADESEDVQIMENIIKNGRITGLEINSEYPNFGSFCGLTFIYTTELPLEEIDTIIVDNIFYNIISEYPNLHLYYLQESYTTLCISIMDRVIDCNINKQFADDKKYSKPINESIDSNDIPTLLLPTLEELKDYMQILSDEFNIESHIYKYKYPYFCYQFTYKFQNTYIIEKHFIELLNNICSNITDDYKNLNILFDVEPNDDIKVYIIDVDPWMTSITKYNAYIYNSKEKEFFHLTTGNLHKYSENRFR